MVKRNLEMEVDRKRLEQRSKTKWHDTIKRDLNICDLKQADTADCVKWRNQIHVGT